VTRIAKSLGVHTVNVVRRAEVAEDLRAAGADLVLVDSDDLGQRVRAEIGDVHLPLALDAVGGHACLHLADCLSDGGKLVAYGFLSGEPCMISPHHAIVHGITLRGFWLVRRLFQRKRDEIEAVYRQIAELITAGTVVAPVEATYRLEDVETALARAEAGGRSGKILFVPHGPTS
jgi:NADPH:quinone reductase-like Zn-dependent oxidoreductase